MARKQQLILLSGLSGAGKSVALRALEDLGYFCVDNLPVPLLAQTTALLDEDGYPRVAIAIDVRSAHNFGSFPDHYAALAELDIDIRLLFLEANDETLIKRFSETRRSHPLAGGKLTVAESVALERELLDGFAELAHRVDSSGLSANQMRSWVREFVALDRSRLTLIFQSFGFKHGLPLDSDFVFDVRCLPNPHYDPALRPLTGKDQPVIDFLEREPKVGQYLTHILGFLERWLPEFERDHRNYVTVAIGCTGGQHRSVYLAEQLAKHFGLNRQVLVRHREQFHA
ncbi:RNase adapter protein RapZ [Andreprevotia sp. IGB-42]|uniref:RNase adapter RapZ n=1 Tax=Andreprevotia sp. IGB-42 TaxID=2497473 RepID=UPI00135CDF91|nr:RNase adapter RapZ [Andreprevotia sp. IGB-42]KAF0814607.1 RNase adapter protein RapZ [Andreprevotia sp. IGB-42]